MDPLTEIKRQIEKDLDPVTKLREKIATEWLPKIEASVEHAAEVCADPNAPREAYDAVHKELDDIQKQASSDVLHALLDALKEDLRRRLLAQGFRPEDIDALLEAKLVHLVKRAATVPDLVQRAKERPAATWPSVKSRVIGIALGIPLVGAVIGISYRSGHEAALGIQQNQRKIQEWIQISAVEDQDLRNALLTPAPIALTPEIESRLPAPVAAIANTSTTIKVQEGTEYTQPLGVVYYNSPIPVQEEIARRISNTCQTCDKHWTTSSPIGSLTFGF